MATRLNTPQKQIRAEVIREFMARAGIERAVCFTSGSAAAALRAQGVDVLAIGQGQPLVPGAWWTPGEIACWFPGLFDATSGHLPAHLMVVIARRLREFIGHLDKRQQYEVPTGSGETIICLRWAYPDCTFVPVYGIGRGTEYEPGAPLNMVVEA